MTFVLTWSVSIAVAAVTDGGVQFTIINHTVDTEPTSEGNLSWVPSADVVASNLKTQMSNSLTNAAANANTNLMNVLANQHRLYLPAKGHFLMHDPVFNSKGDLLVGLDYNG
ncbi:hypothetical protein CI102_14960 [Trichoderma harzianum]|uniref:Uncharacterized protein n=1 Tax=Trichoderma harzianum CBS 226.95 TaxID=983964 RepID=A0A2T4A5H8_TRIHA|nr:hypothetical protein M431DRAFT_91561 [Trichoderma harzianum CBS 226.95]PKK40555.1 hypothetical protein CI102_14960 [Trichoderma harzianum]PTB52330.1 hypothetical protein M431DRAFT_91561 [Trichoderma harzianum CBS 226.95]